MKKLLALLVCMTMIFSLVPAVYAENTVYLTDTFDTDTLGDLNPVLYRGTYVDSNGVLQGNPNDIIGGDTAWAESAADKGDVRFTIITEGEGAYSGQALKLSKKSYYYQNGTNSDGSAKYTGSRYVLGTENIPSATEANPVYVNFKLKIVDDGRNDDRSDGLGELRHSITISGGGGNLLFIKENNGPKMWPNNDDYLTEEPSDDLEKYPSGIKPGIATRFPYELGQWYDITFKFTDKDVFTTVKDNKGNVATGQRAKSSNKGIKIDGDVFRSSTIIVDEMYMIQGEDALNFIGADKGALAFNKTVDVHEDFNFSTPVPSNGNTTDPFSWYMRLDSPVVASNTLAGATSYFATANCSAEMVDDCKGGYAAKITPVAKKYTFTNIGALDITATDKAFVSFRFKYEKPAYGVDGTSPLHLLDIGFSDATSSGSNTTKGYDFRIDAGRFRVWNYWGKDTLYRNQIVCDNLPDVWYTIVVEFQEVNGANQAILRVYDDQGNVVINQAPIEGKTPAPVAGIEKARLGINGIYSDVNTEPYYLDDFRLLQTSAEVNSDAFIKQEILGENEYSPSLPVVKAEFDQIVSEDSTAKFVAEDSEVPAVIYYAGNSPIVEIKPVHPLLDDKTYTLDLSGIKSLSGEAVVAASVSQLKFNTLPYSVGSMTVGDYTISDGTLAVPVTFASAPGKDVTTKLIVALYDGTSLAWAGIKDVKGAALGLNTFTFANAPEGDGLTLKVFAFDNFMSLRALFK